MRSEPIDILMVHYNNRYIGGDLFDNFEYYQFIKKHSNFSVKLLIISEKNTKKALLDKYDLDLITFDGVEFMTNSQIKQKCSVGISFKYNPKIIFSTSSIHIISFMQALENNKIIAPYNKILSIVNGTYEDNKLRFEKSNKRIRDNILFLCDERFKDYYKEYSNIQYKRSLYFDIFKECTGDENDATLINLYTPHKQIDHEKVVNIIRTYEIKKLLIYCHEENILECMKIKVDGVEVEVLIPPIDNLMNRFDRYIYIPVERKWDVSPRLIPEAIWYGKDIQYQGLGSIVDGSYYRCIDSLCRFDDLILKENDDILKILGKYID